MHRTPWVAIAAAVVGMAVLIAAAGTALAVLGSRSQPAASSVTTAGIPSPTPGLIPSPVASPVSTSGGTASNDGAVVPVPPGWTVDTKDSETIVLIDPDSSGSLTIASGRSSPAQSAQDNKRTVDDFFKTTFPDAHSCPNTAPTNTNFNGAAGIMWSVCYTLTAGGHSVPAASWLFAGANPSGSVYYIVMVLTEQSNLQAYLNNARAILQGVKWKLS